MSIILVTKKGDILGKAVQWEYVRFSANSAFDGSQHVNLAAQHLDRRAP